MLSRLTRKLLTALPLLALAGGLPFVQAQPGQPPVGNTEEDVQVLARGPVHEAFATTAEAPAGPAPVLTKQPPDPVEELPPDQRPEGDNVQWIPGYWSYDEDREDFIWISGFWRAAPPGRIWVPGSWRDVNGGYQWVSGFWNQVAQPEPNTPMAPPAPAQVEYLPPPPQPLEVGPSVAAPNDTSFYVTGTWMYQSNRYLWRPGYWVEYRPNWVWAPATYRWTPGGYIFINGYWDYPLANRGMLFAPVYFRPAYRIRPQFVYSPMYAVPVGGLQTSLFIRQGYGSYYFGDYYAPNYYRNGYSSWAGITVTGNNFAISIGTGRRAPIYDPLWGYYSVQNRGNPQWSAAIIQVNTGRYQGTIAPPPRTLVQQTTVINNITNNTTINNVTVKNNTINNSTMVSSIADVKKNNTDVKLKAVSQQERVQEQQHAQALHQVSMDRKKFETNIASKGLAPVKATDAPQTVKLDLPKAAVQRAVTTPAVAPPAAPVAAKNDPSKPMVPFKRPVVEAKVEANAKPADPTKPVQVQVPPHHVDPIKPVTPPVVPPVKPVDPIKPPVTPPVVPPVKPPVVTPPVTPPVVPPVKPPVVTPPVVPPVKPPVVTPPVTPPVVPPVKPPVVTPPVVPPVVTPRPLPMPVTPPVAPQPLPRPTPPPIPQPPVVNPTPPHPAPMPTPAPRPGEKPKEKDKKN